MLSECSDKPLNAWYALLKKTSLPAGSSELSRTLIMKHGDGVINRTIDIIRQLTASRIRDIPSAA